jgi:DNA-binding transcriptional MerR regulator
MVFGLPAQRLRRRLSTFPQIKRSRELGFGIDEIRVMLKMVDQKGVSCGEVHAMTMEHLNSVRKKFST